MKNRREISTRAYNRGHQPPFIIYLSNKYVLCIELLERCCLLKSFKHRQQTDISDSEHTHTVHLGCERCRDVTTARGERDLQYLGNGRVAGGASQHIQLYLRVEQMC